MKTDDLKAILADHALWKRGNGGRCANLADANLADASLACANLADADLRGANLADANLADASLAGANLVAVNFEHVNLANADLRGATLACANLARANLACANLADANLRGANLADASLACANLACANLADADLAGLTGNMREIRSMHIDTWPVVYTADTLQIGCQRHPIAKWRTWTTDEGREWIAEMDCEALAWADRNLALVLQIIDANPATPTGNEASPSGAGQEGEQDDR